MACHWRPVPMPIYATQIITSYPTRNYLSLRHERLLAWQQSNNSSIRSTASRRNKTALAGPSAGHPVFASVPHGGEGVQFAHSIKSWALHAPHAWHYVSAQHVCHLQTTPRSSHSAPLWYMPQMLLARSPQASFAISRKLQ
jgi:hypothetical protein